jgi:hypothetical protein
MSGTAIAASRLVNGDKLIARRSLSGNRLRNHTLTGQQIKLSKLGPVPSALHAITATDAANAADATTAMNATNAVNATNATNAANATTLGGKSIRWLVADANGDVVEQTGGFTVDPVTTGVYVIDAGSSVSGHLIVASSGFAGPDRQMRGGVIAGPCGSATDAITCGSLNPSFDDGDHIIVINENSADTADQNDSFYLMLY